MLKNRKINLLMVTGGELDYGGISTWLYNYIQCLNSEQFNISIAVHGMNKGKREEDFIRIPCVSIFHVPYKNDGLMANYDALNRIMREENYDIVHSHMDAMNSYVLWLAKKNHIAVRISHVHSVFHLNNSIMRVFCHNFLKKYIVKYATRLLACSEDAGVFYYGKRADFCVMPNSIDIKTYSFSKEKREMIRKRYGFRDSFIIGQVGHINENKNQIFTLHIMERLINMGLDTRLMLVGEEEDGYSLSNTINVLGIHDLVVLAGTQREMDAYYSAMDVLVMPSRNEGMPLTALEGQINGLPMLLSDCIPEDAAIGDNTRRLPLDEEKWVEALFEIWKNGRKNFVSRPEEFDECTLAQKLMDFYIGELGT